MLGCVWRQLPFFLDRWSLILPSLFARLLQRQSPRPRSHTCRDVPAQPLSSLVGVALLLAWDLLLWFVFVFAVPEFSFINYGSRFAKTAGRLGRGNTTALLCIRNQSIVILMS